MPDFIHVYGNNGIREVPIIMGAAQVMGDATPGSNVNIVIGTSVPSNSDGRPDNTIYIQVSS